MAKRVIGLTGSFGSGKTAVAHLLQEKGALVIDVDEAGRWAVDANASVQETLRLTFGDVYFPDHRLDRRRLGKLVFADDDARKRLNAIVHPVMILRVEELLQQAQLAKNPWPYIVVDAALLFELQLNRLCDWVVTVSAPESIRIRRARRRDRISQQDAMDRIHAQMAEHDKIRLADYVLDNSDSLRTLSGRVETLHRWILKKVAELNATGSV
ncbi:MAG TPA: dephospho-CoA kinase [bacterium]|jgi:dephospho-CoA kinase|nr:dephospho-CoA kinase [bacterium]HNT65818.1 dephospho-CoA kinase [bacterium]HOX85676.1 dephospho-CoA kinase [bacterium]HPG44835.1 dephospho-CoA kinase [bacterium]HPM98136.1 dephospho-CoA kinase [bacterium]